MTLKTDWEKWIEAQRRVPKRVFFLAMSVPPELAHALMKLNTHNRPCNEHLVAYYARQMAEGLWLETHQGVAVDKNGALLDGQHRLMAIEKAETAALLDIHFNLPPPSFLVIDQPKVRQAWDGLKLAGVETNAKTIHAGYRMLQMIEHGYDTGVQRRTAQECLEFLEANPLIGKCAVLAERIKFYMKIPAGGPATAALFLIAAKAGVKATEAFVELLCKGLGLDSETHPVARYRTRALGRNVGKKIEAAALLIKCWNAYRQGRSVGYLVWRSSEEFPAVAT